MAVDDMEFTTFWKRYEVVLTAGVIEHLIYMPYLEDVMQDVALKLWRKLHTFGGTEKQIGAWLYKLAANIARDFNRRELRQAILSRDAEFRAKYISGCIPMYSDFDRAEKASQLRECMGTLEGLDSKEREAKVKVLREKFYDYETRSHLAGDNDCYTDRGRWLSDEVYLRQGWTAFEDDGFHTNRTHQD